jgi:hypothetical protein
MMSVGYFYSAALVWFYSALDTQRSFLPFTSQKLVFLPSRLW